MASESKPLVLIRLPGEAIAVGDDCVVTVLKVFADRPAASLRITHGSESRTVDLRLYDEFPLGLFVRIALLGLRGERVRLAIDAPRDLAVHRLEVYQAIKDLGIAHR